LAVVNNGTVIATQSTPLLIETSAGITNNGVLRADGGTLQFRNVVVESAGGTIEALNGSQVQLLNGTVINNANFAASGGGLITTVGGATVTLGGGTVSGPMSVVNNSFVRLAADMTYNGVLSMGSVGNFTDLQFDGARTLGGTATISMSNNIQNRLMAATGAGDSATFGSNITVQGAGSDRRGRRAGRGQQRLLDCQQQRGHGAVHHRGGHQQRTHSRRRCQLHDCQHPVEPGRQRRAQCHQRRQHRAGQWQPGQRGHLQHRLGRPGRCHRRQHGARGRRQQHRHGQCQQQRIPGTCAARSPTTAR
jgi:hypothetical protein